MSNLSQFAGASSVPAKSTTYTSGSGTFTPLVASKWLYVTLVGGGGGGSTPVAIWTNGPSGNSGAYASYWLQVATPGTTTYSYAVGAGGAGTSDYVYSVGSDGTATTFGTLTSVGGPAAAAASPAATNGQSNPFGSGGKQGSTYSSLHGQAGTGYGSGGGGSASNGSIPYKSGAGAGGLLIVLEY